MPEKVTDRMVVAVWGTRRSVVYAKGRLVLAGCDGSLNLNDWKPAGVESPPGEGVWIYECYGRLDKGAWRRPAGYSEAVALGKGELGIVWKDI